MITIKIAQSAKHQQWSDDFRRSLIAQASDENNYEIVESDGIPSSDSRVVITLPDNVLVLGNSWDKYILYMLDNKKPITEAFIIRRFSLEGRVGAGVFPEIFVEYPDDSSDLPKSIATS